MTRAKVKSLDVVCPTCGVSEGRRCKGANGKAMEDPHGRRWQVARKVNGIHFARPGPGGTQRHPTALVPCAYCWCGDAIVKVAGVWWHLVRHGKNPRRRKR